MKKRVTFLALVLSLPACSLFGSDDCTVGESAQFFDIEGVSLLAAQRPLNGAERVLAAGEAVAASEAKLIFGLKVRYYGARPATGTWLPAAYACPPTRPNGYNGTTEQLDSVAVTSVHPYDAAHPAGTPLNDLLYSSSDGRLLREVLKDRIDRFDLPLRLSAAPAQPGPQQFRVYYRLRNGEEYTAETVPLQVN